MAKRKKKRNAGKGRIWLVFLLVLAAAAAWGGYFYYSRWMAPNVVRSGKLFIPTGATYEQVLDSLRPFLKDEEGFRWLAERKKYGARIHPGRYSLTQNESNSALINRLRIGAQDEISIRIGNYASIYELAGKVGPLLETDSAGLVQAITGAAFAQSYDPDVLIFFFFPDTYNFHWNTSGEAFVQKMKRQYDLYWTEEKTALARSRNMTPLQATTLASIVQLESAKTDEQPRVAGLYLNRLKIGMKLDADPTVIYAMKKAEGFKRKIQRVYYKNLSIESPYNTYKYAGLPPGPICMPNRSAIDAVLEPASHNFLYFVADPQRPGYHIYATTLKEQEENADKYREWANRNQVR